MITIGYKNIHGAVILDRELKGDELNFSSKLISGNEVVFYYGDEPIIEPDIRDAKSQKKAEIDQNTEVLIARGFDYAGLKWSLSANAQLNWTNIRILPNEKFPITIYSENLTVYLLPIEERDFFYLASNDGKMSILQSGSVLKKQVDGLSTFQEVLDFVDTRMSSTGAGEESIIVGG